MAPHSCCHGQHFHHACLAVIHSWSLNTSQNKPLLLCFCGQLCPRSKKETEGLVIWFRPVLASFVLTWNKVKSFEQGDLIVKTLQFTPMNSEWLLLARSAPGLLAVKSVKYTSRTTHSQQQDIVMPNYMYPWEDGWNYFTAASTHPWKHSSFTSSKVGAATVYSSLGNRYLIWPSSAATLSWGPSSWLGIFWALFAPPRQQRHVWS